MTFQPEDFESHPCDLCGADNATERYTKRGFSIVQCNNCGMVYTNPRLNLAKIGELYDANYFQGHGFDESVNYVADVEEHGATKSSYTLNDWDLDWIQSILKKNGSAKPRLLEIGCGTGVFLDKARSHGFDCEGLELSGYAADFVRSMGIPVQTKSIEDASFADNTWDAIVMREVIEHLPHPLEALRTIHRWLKPGGVLFMATGNYDSPERRLRGSDWFYFMPEGHLYYFANKTMRKYLEKAGFSDIDVTNQGDKLMEKLRNVGILTTGAPKPSNPLGKAAFSLVRGVNHFISSGMRIYAVK
jgi:2-polyprenyl-3-methyl-5-hydroxy-6-metoxy-1,4-benzoquinol methylase